MMSVKAPPAQPLLAGCELKNRAGADVAGAAPTYALREGEDLQPALRSEAVEGVVALELAERLELVRCGAQLVGVNTQFREQVVVCKRSVGTGAVGAEVVLLGAVLAGVLGGERALAARLRNRCTQPSAAGRRAGRQVWWWWGGGYARR